jgi:hypothetical protein
MFSYSNPGFVDAEARYRRERLASDWSSHRARQLDPTLASHVRLAFPSGRTLRGMVRRHRQA